VDKGAIDWLEMTIFGSWHLPIAEPVFKKLHKARDRRAEDESKGWVELPEGDAVRVRATGKPRGRFFGLVIETQGIEIGLRYSSGPEDVAAYIIVNGMVCTQIGASEAVYRARAILVSIGLRETRNTVSRIDLCCDLVGVDMKQFGQLWSARSFRSRPDYESPHINRGKIESIYFGRGLQCRIYDKLAELRIKNDDTKKALLARRWENDDPQFVTRVEFQLRREHIKERFGLATLEEVLPALATIAEYLTGKWLRFLVEPPKTNTRKQDTERVHDVWHRVQRGFANEFSGRNSGTKPKPPQMPSYDQLQKQGVGCLAKVAAFTDEKMDTDEDVETFFQSIAEKLKADFRTLVGRKKQELDQAAKRLPIHDEFAHWAPEAA